MQSAAIHYESPVNRIPRLKTDLSLYKIKNAKNTFIYLHSNKSILKRNPCSILSISLSPLIKCIVNILDKNMCFVFSNKLNLIFRYQTNKIAISY